jgi:hypothetical protein
MARRCAALLLCAASAFGAVDGAVSAARLEGQGVHDDAAAAQRPAALDDADARSPLRDRVPSSRSSEAAGSDAAAARELQVPPGTHAGMLWMEQLYSTSCARANFYQAAWKNLFRCVCGGRTGWADGL